MPPAGRGRGRGRGPAGQGPVQAPPVPFLFSQNGRSVPVLLHVGLGGVNGAADNVGLVGIPSASRLVSQMRFVRWMPQPNAPDGVNRVALASCHLMRLFVGRCQVGPSAADRQAAGQANVFTGRLTADAWSRILSTLLDNGLFDSAYDTLEVFEQSLGTLVIADPTPLQLVAADWAYADALVIPPAAQDQELHDRVAYMRFLSLATVSFLENPLVPNKALYTFGYLAGAVGPCFSQPAREDELAPMHFLVQQLRDHICARAVPDGQATLGLKRVLPDLVLPSALRACFVDAEELTSEFLDAVTYTNPARRAVVEQRRISILGIRSILGPCCEKRHAVLEPSRP